MMGRAMNTLCIDIGGTGLKALVVGDDGKADTERARVDTPQPATPKAVIGELLKLAQAQGQFDRVSVGFPGVVRKGVTLTAHNLDPHWVGFDLASTLSKALGKPVRVCNDADVQGYAVVKGRGVELVITLGTGLGSALFLRGVLVPNLELGHHPFRKRKTYEECLGKKAMDKAGKKKWNKTLRKAIDAMEKCFNYDNLYIGGGNAKKIQGKLPPNVKIVSNVAGLIGGGFLWRSESRGKAKADAGKRPVWGR